jgi:hypothetical protein
MKAYGRVVSFTPLSLYPRGKAPPVPIVYKGGEPHSGLDDMEK